MGGENRGYWGETFLRNGRHEIEIYGLPSLAGDEQWAVHELGHAFVNTGRGKPISALEHYQKSVKGFPDRPLTTSPNYFDNSPWGFAGEFGTWQRSPMGRASEEFADMYVGWVYNQWETGPGGGWSEAGQMRADFMNFFMPRWVN